MLVSRTVVRSTCALRAVSRPFKGRNSRLQSTSTSNSSGSSAFIGGLAGAGAATAGFYAWYHFSGAKTLVRTANETKEYVQTAQKRFVENSPKPNEALRWLRQVTTHYAGFVPGAKGVVETALDDLDGVYSKHGDEVDRIVQDAYNDLKKISSEGLNAQSAQKTWDALQKHLVRVGELARDAASQIVEKHPEIKRQVGENLEQLKQLGDQYGPQAKKQVDETWNQIKDIADNGVSKDSIEKIRKLVQEKTEQLRKLGEETWAKGMDKAMPYLDKNPKVKQIVEDNARALKQGNFEQLFEKVKGAVESGDTAELDKYVKDSADRAKKFSSRGFDPLFKSIPGGDQILPKLQDIQQIAEKHGDDAKKLLEETIHDVTEVLSKKAEKANKLAQEVEKASR